MQTMEPTASPAPATSVATTELALVIPVHNDWQSLEQLLGEIDDRLADRATRLNVVIVDDGSTIPSPDRALEHKVARFHSVVRIRLATNLGHQSAIATGLSHLNNSVVVNDVAVMDADGEDRPADLLRLIEEFAKHRDQIVVAIRSKRSEGLLFAIAYHVYRLLFRLLTGKSIRFGNFCLIPATVLPAVVYSDGSWVHLGATLARLPHPIVGIATVRGTRYFGPSHMNYVRLIIHGLAAISVCADFVVIRATIIAFLGMFACTIGIAVVIYVRIATDWAIAGWATYALGLLTVVFIQSCLLALASTLLYLTGRSGQRIVPARDSSTFIRECVWLRRP